MKKIYSILLCIGLVAGFVACEKDKEFALTTLSINNEVITPAYNSADVRCSFKTDATISDAYVQYALSSSFAKYEVAKMTEEKGIYTAQLVGLADNTTYYIRYEVSNKYSSVVTEEVKAFQTLQCTVPTIVLDTITDVMDSHAKVQIHLTFDGGASVTDMGVCWSTHANPTTKDIHISTEDTLAVLDVISLQPNTKYYVRAYAQNKVGVAYSEEKAFTTESILSEPTGTENGYAYVDLGLSVKWATMNVGANSPEDSGDYFAWGETEPQYSYYWNTYKYCNGSETTLTKYNSNEHSGTVDNKITLELIDDAAHVNWEGNWRMPTAAEWTELREQCTWTWTSKNGVKGHKVTSKGNGNSIFLPAAGRRFLEELVGVGVDGNYWSNTLNVASPCEAMYLLLISSGAGNFGTDRYSGYSVRPVFGEKVVESTIATVTTSAVSQITETTAVAGGNVTADGNASVTERGVCIATVSNPTTYNTKITAGSGTGSFTCNLTGLQENTTYYIRAYATNEKGTAYGEEVSFTTKEQSSTEPGVTETITVNGVSFKMVAVEGGTFTMGATSEQGSDADSDEITHSVTLSDFAIGETEVTQELWQAVMGSNPSYFSGTNLPVEMVSWNDCHTFISKLNNLTGKNFRLPTEAEWEYAARGGNRSKGYKYAGSNTLGDVAWYGENSSSKTHPVKQKQVNELGLYDMSGNVWEWCQDWYGSYSSSAQTNPTGSTSGSYRVRRGGCWSNDTRACRVSNRSYDTPTYSNYYLGLRLALGAAVELEVALPTLTTNAVTQITETTAEAGGNVTADGNASVTERGVCIATVSNPTTAHTKITSGNGTGSFTCNLTGLQPNTTYYVRAYAVNSKGTAYGEEVSFTTQEQSSTPNNGTENGYAYVDLGLSVKWATMNVGASSPEDYGDYFAWGETEPKDYYHWSTYKYCNGSYDSLTKYNTQSKYGTVDNKTQLDLSDDAAHVNWGGSWRMPTDAEWTELREQCTWTWTSQNGVNGYKVTSKSNCNSIFLPAAGFRDDSSLYGAGSGGFCWSSSHNSYSAYELDFSSASVDRDIADRYYGQSVRPVWGVYVMEETVPTIITTTVTQITETSAVAGGNVTSDGGASVTERGVVYSINQNPTTADNKIPNGSGMGSFTCDLTSLQPNTTYYVRAYATNEVGTAYGEEVSFTTQEQSSTPNNGTENGYAYVDLGLSVKWATMNVGASSPEEYGDYFAWGETTIKSTYDWSTYKYCNGSYDFLTKYNNRSDYGTVDNKTTLELSDDAARANWGGSWRMPTNAELTALRNNCTWTWTTQNGVNGYKVTSKSNGNSIFLPAAGIRDGSSLDEAGSVGYYWSSSLSTNIVPSYAWYVNFYSGYVSGNGSGRYLGCTVRPVCP